MTNDMCIKFRALPENEVFARVCVSAFILPLDPKMNDMTDIKTAVSEAVTNAVIHGYEDNEGEVELKCGIDGCMVYIEVKDCGCGIEDIQLAKKPLYTSKPELERSGMGFTVMEAFMDELEVISEPGKGTTIRMIKRLSL